MFVMFLLDAYHEGYLDNWNISELLTTDGHRSGWGWGETLVRMSSVAHIKREAGEGIPVVATPSRYTAPVHIDVGGSIYTSSLDTLTKWVPDRR